MNYFRQIGGYLQFEELLSNPYHKDCVSLNAARYCVTYLIRARKIQNILLPYYLCDSVRDACEAEGVSWDHYEIADDFSPILPSDLSPYDAVYLVDYFGQLRDEVIQKVKERHPVIILDCVESFFRRPLPEIDTIYSCRKFFGVPDGAYLYTAAKLKEELPEDYSASRFQHLLGRYEGTSQSFYASFREASAEIAEAGMRRMSEITQNLLGAIPYEAVRMRREANWLFLHRELAPLNSLRLHESIGPFMYPFYCEEAGRLRAQLAREDIFIPLLWKEVTELAAPDSWSYRYADNLLLLPCDQRYDQRDMEHMLSVLKNYL